MAPTTFILDKYIYYLQGVIRPGQVEDGDFSQTWPEQGYRISLSEVTAYLDEMSTEIEASDETTIQEFNYAATKVQQPDHEPETALYWGTFRTHKGRNNRSIRSQSPN